MNSETYNSDFQQLIQALQESKRFATDLKEKNEKLTLQVKKLREEKDKSHQQEVEEAKKTIRILTEQNKQIQQKLMNQENKYKNYTAELNQNLQKVINENQILRQKIQIQQDGNQKSENIQDDSHNELRINQAINYERINNNKQINNHTGNGIQSYAKGYEASNVINGNSNNAPNQFQNGNITLQAINQNIKQNDNSDSYRSIFTFSNSNQNEMLANQFPTDPSYTSQGQYTASTNEYSQINFKNTFGVQGIKNISKNIDQMKVNESNLSASNSRLDYSPNNRYNNDISQNIRNKYNQNFLKISQSTNIFSSFQSNSPQSKRSDNTTSEDKTNQDANSYQKKKLIFNDEESNKRKHIQKMEEEDLNLTDDDDEQDSQEDNNELCSVEDDEISQKNRSYLKKSSNIIKQTPKEFETKSHSSRQEGNISRKINQFDSKLSLSGVSMSIESVNQQENYSSSHREGGQQQQQQQQYNPQLNYYRQELGNNKSNPKYQLEEELKNYGGDTQFNNNNNNQNNNNNNTINNQQNNDQLRMYQNSSLISRQPVIQESARNLDQSQNYRSQGKHRKIFEQNQNYTHQNSTNNLQTTTHSTGIYPNKSESNLLLQQNQSQVSFNNQNQFERQNIYYPIIQSQESSNLRQLDNKYNDKNSAYFDVASISFNDNKQEQQYSQILYSPDKSDTNLSNPQFNTIRVLQTNNYLRKNQRRNTAMKDNQSENSNAADQQSSISNMKELYPSQIQDQQSDSRILNFDQTQIAFDNKSYTQKNTIEEQGSKIYFNQAMMPEQTNKFSTSSSLNSYGMSEIKEPVQRVQIKSPKNMMDISMNNQISSQNVDFQKETFTSQNNLMENFFILSADQTCIKERIMTTNEIQFVQAETIYCYPHMTQQMQQNEKSIQQLAFPQGVYVKQKLKTNSQSDLLEIVMYDKKKDQSSDGFVFTLKTEQSYEKSDNSNKHARTKNKDVYDVVNPNKLLYCICIQQKTFIDFKYDPKQLKNSKKMKKEFFYEVDSIYCIVTKFPNIQFYSDIIENVLNMIKVSKSENFGRLDTIDLDLYYYKKIQSEIEEKLSTLVQSKIPLFNGDLFSLPMKTLDQKPVNLSIKCAEEAQFIECNWGLVDALRKFEDSNNFVKLYISLLLEQSVVFVSTSRTTLSQFILLFHSLIKPLKWPHPMIITLPRVLNELLYSPTPMIIGLNETKKQLDQIHFSDKYPEFNVVYLDEMIFNFQNDLAKDELKDSDFITILNLELNQKFNLLKNKTTTPREKVSYEHHNDERKKYEVIAQQILRTTQDVFCEHIVHQLPSYPLFKIEQNSAMKNLDFSLIHQEINKTKMYPDNFLDRFFRTQIFTFYMEEYYGIA